MLFNRRFLITNARAPPTTNWTADAGAYSGVNATANASTDANAYPTANASTNTRSNARSDERANPRADAISNTRSNARANTRANARASTRANARADAGAIQRNYQLKNRRKPNAKAYARTNAGSHARAYVSPSVQPHRCPAAHRNTYSITPLHLWDKRHLLHFRLFTFLERRGVPTCCRWLRSSWILRWLILYLSSWYPLFSPLFFLLVSLFFVVSRIFLPSIWSSKYILLPPDWVCRNRSGRCDPPEVCEFVEESREERWMSNNKERPRREDRFNFKFFL